MAQSLAEKAILLALARDMAELDKLLTPLTMEQLDDIAKACDIIKDVIDWQYFGREQERMRKLQAVKR